jgi:polysaccharide pyruvyl transferase WcaK-like protein
VRRLLRRIEGEARAEWGTRSALQRSAGLLRGQDAPIGYLGFAGRGNLGDDAILLAHVRALALRRLALLPLESERVAYATLRRLRPRPLFHGVLMGGGTLLGRSPWRRRLELALATCDGPVAITGVGVEDPEFRGARVYTDREELARWTDLLGRADHLTVRGPRSAELLRDIGVQAAVVSDSALLLAPEVPPATVVQPKLLGVSIADPEDRHAGTGDRVQKACLDALNALSRAGWRARLLAFDRRDHQLAEALARRLDARPEIVSPAAGVDAMLRSIGECDVLVGERLHSIVLAAAAAVPALAIDYRPKCQDFQDSIGRGEWTVRSTDITARTILEAVAQLHHERAHHVQAIQEEVAHARTLLVEGERAVQRILAPD